MGNNHAGYAVNAAFFDFDKDNDLDMFLVNQGPEKTDQGRPSFLRTQVHKYCGDRLYENIGNRFEDITYKAGIWSSDIGFGHGVSVGDLNGDGWEDIFVSNDFFEYDYVYFNNGDKTFTERVHESMKHISFYSMGNDMADFNNDGFLDIVVVDMVAEDHYRNKSNLGGMKPYKFWSSVNKGLHHQYMNNVLHMNNGDGTFSEVGQMANISNTDWSWASLIVDFNNDGQKDIFVTNGLGKDIRNTDFAKVYAEMVREYYNIFTKKEYDFLLNAMPSVKVKNYMYKNNGDLTFTNMAEAWGTGQPSFSNGAAYGDLDNDGDLDLIVNNINDFAFVYENQSDKFGESSFLKIKFSGPNLNPFGIGAKVSVSHGNGTQLQQLYLTRGYRSSMEPSMIFGLGADSIVKVLDVKWPDGKSQILKNVRANQELMIEYNDANFAKDIENVENPVFLDITKKSAIEHKHIENDYNDFVNEPMLPHKMSSFGPSMAVSDVNGDGLEDFFVGGSTGYAGHLFLQNQEGSFDEKFNPSWNEEKMYEDMGTLFFDVDSDGDQDLYVVSGGSEYEEGDSLYQDRFYYNDGSANFIRSVGVLPEIISSGSKAVPCDFDLDGDIDLFVGGRLVPGKYPRPADSYLLKNEAGVLIDITDAVAHELRKVGMVTSAIWMDYDNDKDEDLIVCGEWMPVTIFRNDAGTFNKVAEDNGLENSAGWWFSLAQGDFDEDGDPDIIAGNLGWNYEYKASIIKPFEIYSHDFSGNNKLDIVLGYYENSVLYPFHDRGKSMGQVPQITESFETYNDFAGATLEEIYGKKALDSALNYKAKTFTSSYIENTGNGNFVITPLNSLAQIAPTNSILVKDINQDQHLDIIIAGNLYATEVETIRADAGIGLYLEGDGNGNFSPVPYYNSGLYADGDVKDMKLIHTIDGPMLLVASNNDHTRMIKIGTKD